MMNEFPFGYVKNKQGQDSHAIADWKHIDGKPTDLVDKPALDAAIAGIQKPDLSGYLTQASLASYVVKGELPDFTKFALKTDLPTFDPNTVYTKDEVNAAIVKAIGDLQDKIYGGDVNAALDTIKELQDAYNGSNTIIQRLLTQMANKANVGDSYTKGDSDARYPLKADIPDITPLAKQVDLSLVEKYGLPRNYWIVKNQTNGYSMDSVGNPTVANDKAQTSELIKYDSAIQMVFVGWGADTGDQMTVAYFDKDKKYLSSTIWTITAKGTGDNPRSNIEFYKYAPNNAAYIRVNCNYGANAKTMIVSSIFENADWTPALEDLPPDIPEDLVTTQMLDDKITALKNAASSTVSYPIVRNHVNDLFINDPDVSILYIKPVVREIQYDAHFGLLYLHVIYTHNGDEQARSGWNGFHIDNIVGDYAYDTNLVNDGNAIGVGNFSGGYPLGFFATHINSISKNGNGTNMFQFGIRSASVIPNGTRRDINVQVPLVYDGNLIS